MRSCDVRPQDVPTSKDLKTSLPQHKPTAPQSKPKTLVKRSVPFKSYTWSVQTEGRPPAVTRCMRCDLSMFTVPFNSDPRLNKEEPHQWDFPLLFKKKKKEADCSSCLQPEKSSKHELHYSALPSLHDNTADKQELFSDQTATTVGHSYFRPLVKETPSNYWDIHLTGNASVSSKYHTQTCVCCLFHTSAHSKYQSEQQPLCTTAALLSREIWGRFSN